MTTPTPETSPRRHVLISTIESKLDKRDDLTDSILQALRAAPQNASDQELHGILRTVLPRESAENDKSYDTRIADFKIPPLGLDDEGALRQIRLQLWRPSVAMVMQDLEIAGWTRVNGVNSPRQHEKKLAFDAYYFIYNGAHSYLDLVTQVLADVKSVNPDIELYEIPLRNPNPALSTDSNFIFDISIVYPLLYQEFNKIRNDPANKDAEFYVNCTHGTTAERNSLFLLTHAERLPNCYQIRPRPVALSQHRPAGFCDIDTASGFNSIFKQVNSTDDEAVRALKQSIDTQNATYNTLIEEISRVCVKSNDPILLTGPTGCGKTELAKRIFALKREQAPQKMPGHFVSVNCATLGTLAHSQLFGHVAGSYTDAKTDHVGYLQQADGGMLFLDEVGDLDPTTQTMLLKALEEHTFIPLGASEVVTSNFQLICGTNIPLYALVQQGKFRRDLLERINFWHFRLPGLKDRPEDIKPNLEHELSTFAKNLVMTPEAEDAFLERAQNAPWHGNFREFHNLIRRITLMAPGNKIDEETVVREFERSRKIIDDDLREAAAGTDAPTPAVPQPEPVDPDARLRELLGAADFERISPLDRAQLRFILDAACPRDTLQTLADKVYGPTDSSKANYKRLRTLLEHFRLRFKKQGKCYRFERLAEPPAQA